MNPNGEVSRVSSKDKVVVVGGASGIGAALVTRLRADGSEVIVVDRSESSGGSRHITVDLRDRAEVDRVLGELGGEPIDRVAYVAGLPGTWPDADVLAVNFLAMRHFLQAVAPAVRAGGAIAVVTSTAGAGWPTRLEVLEPLLATMTFEDGAAWVAGSDGATYPMYNTSKEAAIVFVKRWAYTLWTERGIRLNAISPGPVETPILADFEESMGKQALDGVRALIGRHGTPDDIAAVIAAVLGGDFGWVTGQDIQADGGFTNAWSAGSISF